MVSSTIKSLLDLDLYKLTQQQFFWKNFPNLKVKYQFINRSDIDLSKVLTKTILEEEFNNIKSLSFTQSELSYLETLGLFEKDFLNYLKNYKLPDLTITEDLKIHTNSNNYCKDAILWETIVLSTINQLYYKHKYPNPELISEKINGLTMLRYSMRGLSNAKIKGLVTDFGTRRRFSHEWHDTVCSYISKHESFSGTSNVYFAKKYGMTPIGTNAHELYMIAAGVFDKGTDESLRNSQNTIIDKWYDMYGYESSIALSDTFGTDFFFEDFKTQAPTWKGIRHDSGDAVEFGESVIQYYKSLNIDPKTKMLIFSDGLDIPKIIELYNKFNGRIKISFGWGTKLTNNVGYETLSIVMKAVEVISNDDIPINNSLVKLSDNLNKHMGTDKDITRYKKAFNYKNTNSETLIV